MSHDNRTKDMDLAEIIKLPNLLDQRRRRLRAAEKTMAHASSYAEWEQAARDFEQVSGAADWRAEEASSDYDYKLVRSRLKLIRKLLDREAIGDLMYELRQGLHWNIGNSGNPLLYGYSPLGTKHLINDYLQSIIEALEWIARTEKGKVSRSAKREFFADLARSYGRSALMLSGGATMGLFHVGVVRTLYAHGLLPETISGASAGALVGSAVTSRTPDEAEELMDPSNIYLDMWGLLAPRDMLRTGALMDQNKLRRGIAHNIPDVTFEESEAASGRSMNITVSPVAANQPARLLNHLTFPHLYLREAVLASCAVPFLFPPVKLATRNRDGGREPYMPSLRWADGSLISDLPRMRLRRLFNVNHFIVSQTNPHVLPFLSNKEPTQRGVAHGVRQHAFGTVRHQARSLFGLARSNLPPALSGLRRYLDHAAGILDQDYRGNVTISPGFDFSSYSRVIRNPRLSDVHRMILQGERATWPKLAMIRHQTMISRTLEDCLDAMDEPASKTAAA